MYILTNGGEIYIVKKKQKTQANHKSSDGRFECAEATFSHVQYFFLLGTVMNSLLSCQFIDFC